MQNWEAMQPTANYDQHNSWYNSMFAANIKTEPGSTSPHLPAMPSPPLNNQSNTASQLEQFLKHQHAQQQQHHTQMDTLSATASAVMTPSPSQNDSLQHFFDSNMQQQILQQQQYQQQFQQAQQAAAQNQAANAAVAHMSLGFNPLTPPGLPNAVLPTLPHFYQQQQRGGGSNSAPQTPSPQPTTVLSAAHNLITPNDSLSEKLQAALTPRHTPPMDVSPTPPVTAASTKSPIKTETANNTTTNLAAANTSMISQDLNADKEQDLISNSSEDMKYMIESDNDDDSIRMPIYNSHGKMKNYKCKSCSMVAITKVAFWEHARSHMKPEKILQCPKCPFVTELKHHLEYHIRKHKNLKPFQCDKCSYSCVNKSMLNSHRKSHSSVYQYRCADCDYATKYCHSFKLHLRKYEHKPGMVLDEEGIPNPSVIIDVYGTRRGPKSKNGGGSGSGGSGGGSKRGSGSERHSNANDLKLPATSQLSAALQGFPMPQQQLSAVSPAKSISSCSATSDLPSQMSFNMQKLAAASNQAQQAQQQQAQNQQNQQQQQQQNTGLPNLLPPLASILQQNRNMAPFFPYWNLNLQMLAAQQQAAVLAQMSPRMRETALQQMQQTGDGGDSWTHGGDDEDEEDEEEHDNKSVDSAMDLSQGTPTKDDEQQQTTPDFAMNLKLESEQHTNDTPLLSSMSASRRKGRVLKLDSLLQAKSEAQTPEVQQQKSLNNNNNNNEMPLASSPINAAAKIEDPSSADESMEVPCPIANGQNSANTSASSTASSSGNSSNSSNVSSSTGPTVVASTTTATANGSSASSSGNSSAANSPQANGAIYECKYCDIYFKDAVLYTIHMGYHSCDDVFKCNMCGEKCDGPVGLFVHMARNAHS